MVHEIACKTDIFFDTLGSSYLLLVVGPSCRWGDFGWKGTDALAATFGSTGSCFHLVLNVCGASLYPAPGDLLYGYGQDGVVNCLVLY